MKYIEENLDPKFYDEMRNSFTQTQIKEALKATQRMNKSRADHVIPLFSSE